MGAAAASASLAVSSVGDALGRSGRPLARRALLSRRRPGGGRGRCSVLEAGHDANARELLAQGAHWLGEEVGDGVRHAWCPRADVEGQANVLRDDAPFQDVGRRVPDAVPVLKKLAHSDGGRGLLPLSSERFDEIAAGAVHRAASATLRPVVPDVDARRELGVAAGAILAGHTVKGNAPARPNGQQALEGAVQVWVGEEGIDGGLGSIQSMLLVPPL